MDMDASLSKGGCATSIPETNSFNAYDRNSENNEGGVKMNQVENVTEYSKETGDVITQESQVTKISDEASLGKKDLGTTSLESDISQCTIVEPSMDRHANVFDVPVNSVDHATSAAPQHDISEPVSAPAPMPVLNGNPNNSNIVRVEDAMNYLDQVKVRFNYQPEIYNNFLDIMKEFKSDSINITCVTNRVMELFKDHPDLILGFNVFLPAGGQITMDSLQHLQQQICAANSPAAPMIGNIMQCNSPVAYIVEVEVDGNGCRRTGIVPAETTSMTSIMQSQNQLTGSTEQIVQTVTGQDSSPQTDNSNSYVTSNEQHVVFTYVPHPTHQQQNAGSIPAANNEFLQVQGDYQYGVDVQLYANKQPEEYNQALHYVNKIKCRLEHEKYKQFLEVLHAYQKDQRRVEWNPSSERKLTEQDIYCKVSKLFEGHPDLLEEFVRYVNLSPGVAPPISSAHRNINIGTVAAATCTNELIREQRSPSVVTSNTVSPMAYQFNPRNSNESKRVTHSPLVGASRKKPRVEEKPTMRMNKIAEQGESFGDFGVFLKKVRLLFSLSIYEDFLRILFLFNQDILSQAEFVQSITTLFREKPDLLKWLKSYIDSSKVESNKLKTKENTRAKGTVQDKEMFDVLELNPSLCRRLGHSYVHVPSKRYRFPECSGRTPLCDEVLNDEWISYPAAWTEPACCLNKRVSHEENMFKCEEERFELDFVIQTNADAIKHLDKVNRQMNEMKKEEREKLQLDDCLGTQSIIHLRAVKRIYGVDAADKVIEGLKRCPHVAVPIVLKRLKQKDDEWRQVQRECNKICHEQEKRYYWKSLDYMVKVGSDQKE